MSLSGFLGLDLIRSIRSDPNLNALLLSIAMWFFPGFLSLVKTCVRKRKQLGKKPFVKELINDNVFIDTLFSPATVEKIKGVCGIQQSFSLIVSSGNPASRPSKRLFWGKSSSFIRCSGSRTAPYSHPTAQAPSTSSRPQYPARSNRGSGHPARSSSRGNRGYKGPSH